MTPKDKVFGVRLTDDERKKLDDAAEKAGFKDKSEYVRYMTIGGGSEIQEELKEIKAIIKKLKK